MENRIKEQQLGLFADRTSTAKMRSNQLRLYFSSMYCLLEVLRRLGLKGSEMAEAQCSTIRLRLSAPKSVSPYGAWISMAAGHPGASELNDMGNIPGCSRAVRTASWQLSD